MPDVSNRFLSKVFQADSGCLEWTGAVTSAGYGNFWDGNRYRSAHLYSYEINRGEVPTGQVLDHLCRNRLCINSDHLDVVSCRENTLRGKSFSAKHSKQAKCLNGHLFDEENTRTYRNRRYCNQCARDRYRNRIRTEPKQGE